MNDKLQILMVKQVTAMAELLETHTEQLTLMADILQNTVRRRLDEHSGNITDIGNALSAMNDCIQTLVGKQARSTPNHLTVVVNNDAAGD